MSGFSFSHFYSCYLCVTFILALFHLCSSNQNFNDVLCIKEESQALLQFKHRLVDEGGQLASWGDELNDCCKWAGIVCDNKTGHVLQIHLRVLDGQCHDYSGTEKEFKEASKKRLKGELSPSLLDLKQLEHLDLSCNDFEKIQVPEFIGSLENLRYLNLSSSNFSGIIPPQLGNLSQLHTLCIGSFQDDWFTESTSVVNMEWLSNLHLLRHLDMSKVDLGKAMDWFQVINNLPSLAELHLKDSFLLDVHPHVPTLNITSLVLLDLSWNQFSNSLVPQWIFSITSLVSLDLSGCGFSSSSGHTFRNLTSLKWLHVSEKNTFMNSSFVLKELSSGIGSNLISLDISDCHISSKALDSLHNLTSVLSLDLSYNQLTDIIPKSLGNLCNLRETDLSYNNFQNISLTYLLQSLLKCKSPHLESLSISDSRLSGTIPYSIGRLSMLEVLDISDNQLDGSLPNSLGQLSKLEELYFSSNFLTGVVTETHFLKLVHLKYLSGGGNNLILRPRIANWIPPFQLEGLDLESWSLGPQFPSWLLSQRELIELYMSSTNISSLPESFWRSFPNLGYLNMSKNQMQGTVNLSGFPALTQLDLSSNKFRGNLPDILNGSFPSFMDLSNNLFVGTLHHLLCLDGVKETGMLNLGNNSLSGVIPMCWEKWQSLSVLNLENNKFSGGIPRTLGHVRYMRSLSMRGNKLDGNLPASLMNLTRLEFLELSGNVLAGSIPSWLGTELSSLILLNLRSNKFDGKIPHEGHGYMYDRILNFMVLLDLSNNKLVGHIPSELTTLIKLKSLNLSMNHLTGRIPEKIGDLKEVESFDLSQNKLTGELPRSLSNLNSLSSFNVSYNNLTGKIPSSTQLGGFNESCFVGNKLCGDPLMSEPCSRVKSPDADHDEDDGSHGVDWGLIISVVSGFIVGFWVILVPVIVSRSWRIAYFRFLNDLGYMVYDVTNKIFSM